MEREREYTTIIYMNKTDLSWRYRPKYLKTTKEALGENKNYDLFFLSV